MQSCHSDSESSISTMHKTIEPKHISQVVLLTTLWYCSISLIAAICGTLNREIYMLLTMFNIINVGVTILCFSFIVLVFAAIKWYKHMNEFKKR
jgi:uncharacterized Tic20 family protein